MCFIHCIYLQHRCHGPEGVHWPKHKPREGPGDTAAVAEFDHRQPDGQCAGHEPQPVAAAQQRLLSLSGSWRPQSRGGGRWQRRGRRGRQRCSCREAAWAGSVTSRWSRAPAALISTAASPGWRGSTSTAPPEGSPCTRTRAWWRTWPGGISHSLEAERDRWIGEKKKWQSLLH